MERGLARMRCCAAVVVAVTLRSSALVAAAGAGRRLLAEPTLCKGTQGEDVQKAVCLTRAECVWMWSGDWKTSCILKTDSPPDFDVEFPDSSCTLAESQDYTEEMAESDFGHGWKAGLERADLTCTGELVLEYPEGCVGSQACATQIKAPLYAWADEVWFSYEVQFEPGFEFVKGGKLPGVCGGECNTGGSKPDGTDGWSVRLMWRTGGKIVLYVYHPDQTDDHADDVDWCDPANTASCTHQTFVPGTWHRVTVHVRLNTPGQTDGLVEAFLDGAAEHSASRSLRFRDVEGLEIDTFYLSTFFGGSSSDWASPKDQWVKFRYFSVGAARADVELKDAASTTELGGAASTTELGGAGIAWHSQAASMTALLSLLCQLLQMLHL